MLFYPQNNDKKQLLQEIEMHQEHYVNALKHDSPFQELKEIKAKIRALYILLSQQDEENSFKQDQPLNEQ